MARSTLHTILVNPAYQENKALHYCDSATRVLLRQFQNQSLIEGLCAHGTSPSRQHSAFSSTSKFAKDIANLALSRTYISTPATLPSKSFRRQSATQPAFPQQIRGLDSTQGQTMTNTAYQIYMYIVSMMRMLHGAEREHYATKRDAPNTGKGQKDCGNNVA